VLEFHHNPSKALPFPVEVANCHLLDIITSALKLGCSGESEIIPKIDEGAWEMAHPPHNINMTAIKNEVEDILKKRLACFFLTNLTGSLRLKKIAYSVIAGYR
jgi:hypothetical protein